MGGVAAPGDDAVVSVINDAVGLGCSGTLVEPRLVVTAKHCVQAPGAAGLAAAARLRVGVVAAGHTDPDDAAWLDVATATALPGAYRAAPDDVADLAGADVAVLTLASDATVASAPPRVEPVRIDETLRAVGFGVATEGDGAGAGRRWVAATVTGQRGDLLATTAAACAGDSGGALLDADGRLVAVISSRVGSCADGETQATLVSAGAALLTEARCALGLRLLRARLARADDARRRGGRLRRGRVATYDHRLAAAGWLAAARARAQIQGAANMTKSVSAMTLALVALIGCGDESAPALSAMPPRSWRAT